jgi:hypothetical protein
MGYTASRGAPTYSPQKWWCLFLQLLDAENLLGVFSSPHMTLPARLGLSRKNLFRSAKCRSFAF